MLRPPASRSAGPGGLSGESSGEGGDDYSAEHETTYRLCPNYASDINSPLRCAGLRARVWVRARAYIGMRTHMHMHKYTQVHTSAHPYTRT